MTAAQDLADMATITQARYEQRQQAFAMLVAEENRLRAEIKRLDAMRHDADAADGQAIELRAIGADVIWQGWLGRAKTALNLDLARVLAVKEHHMQEVRRAYGKVLVINEMKGQLRREVKKSVVDNELSQAIALSIFG